MGNANEKVSEAIEFLKSSPMRNKPELLIQDKEDNALEEELLTLLSDARRQHEKLLSEPLKIVVMGEVKAGKSTLINSLVKEEVSQMDVLEATASINIIEYGSDSECIINFKDRTQSTSIPEALALFKKNQNVQDFFSNIDYVIFHMSHDGLKGIHVIDTPGLETITEGNKERTLDFINESDVVLWAYNATLLGSEGINEIISKVKSRGKKLICILTRIDEVDGSEAEVLSYAKQEMGMYFDAFFTLDGRTAWQGVVEKDSVKMANSGLIPIHDYIFTTIASRKNTILNKTVMSSVAAIIHMDLALHAKQKELIVSIQELFSDQNGELEEVGAEAVAKTLKFAEERLIETVYTKEKQSFASKIQSLGFLHVVDFNKKVEELLKEYFTESILVGYINKVRDEAEGKYKEFWDYGLQQLDAKLVSKQQSAIANLSLSLGNEIAKVETRDSGAVEAGITSIGMAGGIAVIHAAYAAGLGPAAAWLSFGGALSVVLLPTLVGGALVGAIVGAAKFIKSKDTIAASVIHSIDENIKKAVSNDLLPKFRDELNDSKAKIISTIRQTLEDKTLKGKALESFTVFGSEVIEYISRGEKIHKSLRVL